MILDLIVAHKKKEIRRLIKKNAVVDFRKSNGNLKRSGIFYKALANAQSIAVIAEIKRRSPSKGILRADFRPVILAKSFEKSGASALSVLTDQKFFGGSNAIFKKVRMATSLPLLRKEFILEECQVAESAALGADAILLIAAILTTHELKVLSQAAEFYGMDTLFEVHSEKDVEKVLPLKPKLVGINNRNLRTFSVKLRNTERLAKYFPKKTLIVAESGIGTVQDLELARAWGARAALVGESLMREKNPGQTLERLLGRIHGSG